MKRVRLVLSVAVVLTGCSDSFLRGLSAPEPPNDGGTCGPNGRAVNLRASVSAQGVSLAWFADATDADGILVERADQEAVLQWTELGRVPQETRQFADVVATPDSVFVYRVSTFRVEGATLCAAAPSDPVEVPTLPLAPESVTAQPGTGGVQLTWADTNTFESGYNIERKSGGAGFAIVGTVAADAQTHVDITAIPGASYSYRVAAFNNSGSTPSPAVALTTPTIPGLSWSDDPYLDATCAVVLPGETQFAGTTFGSADGQLSVAFDTVAADEDGATIGLTSVAAGDIDASWSVTDDFGGQATLNRNLSLAISTQTIGVERGGTLSPGDFHIEGMQALMPSCATCSGRRGSLSSGLSTFSCTVTATGEVLCWGENDVGQIGRGRDFADVWPPLQPCDGAGLEPCSGALTAVQLETASGVSCVRTPGGEIRCFGDVTYGQQGRGPIGRSSGSLPGPVCALGSSALGCAPMLGALDLAVASQFACAVQADTSVACWGDNTSGKLGVGFQGSGGGVFGSSESEYPVPVCETGVWDGATCSGGAPLSGVQQVFVQSSHACALLANGRAMCWGSGSSGRLGNGSTSTQSNPVFVGGGTPLENIVELALGASHSCARLMDGTARCWGRGSVGQLGYGGTTSTNSSPREVCATGEDGVDCVALADIRQISAGDDNTCVRVGPEQAVYCWGEEDAGALGNGQDSVRNVNPGPVCLTGVWDGMECVGGEPLVGVDRVVVSLGFSCALLPGGEALCWGDNRSGVLGDGEGTELDTLNPSPVCASGSISTGCPLMTDIADINGGLYHQCVIQRSTQEVLCWGNAEDGQLGDGTTRESFPIPVCGAGRGASCVPLDDAVQVAVGGAHACALRADGTPWCWGINIHGELGQGNFVANSEGLPAEVCAQSGMSGCTPLTGVVALVSGGSRSDFKFGSCGNCDMRAFGHTCAVLDDGTAVCWGDNRSGQLGLGSRTDRTAESCVDSGSCGNGICDNGLCFNVDRGVNVPRVVACGEGCVDPTTPLSGIEGIAAGEAHTCAWRTDGSVLCWGSNSGGQLGDDQIGAERSLPVLVPISNVAQMVAGIENTCALLTDGTARCWGDNNWGQLADGTTQGRALPAPVCDRGLGASCEPVTGIVTMAAGSQHICALLEDSRLKCWGRNNRSPGGIGVFAGRLGRGFSGDQADDYIRPEFVCEPDPNIGCQDGYVCDRHLSGVVAVSAGYHTTCALLEDGRITCFGEGTVGELGDGGATLSESCVPTSGICPASDPLCDAAGALSSSTVQTCDVATVSVR